MEPERPLALIALCSCTFGLGASDSPAVAYQSVPCVTSQRLLKRILARALIEAFVGEPKGGAVSTRRRALAVVAVLGTVVASPAWALQTFDEIPWTRGPATGDLGAEAEVQVPTGCMFTGREGTKMFMELTENPVGRHERGVVLCNVGANADPWFAVFTFSPSGYVKDDESDQLDASSILKTLRGDNEAGNKARRDRGWETLEIEGWVQEPFYDTATNNLTWSLTATTSGGSRSVNHSVRILGRGGVMHADLVSDPATLKTALPVFETLVSGYGYKAGHRYAEWREGDKLAEYGLTALIAGGAGVAAAKSGLLGKLWKLIAAGVAATLAGLKRMFARKKTPAGARA